MIKMSACQHFITPAAIFYIKVWVISVPNVLLVDTKLDDRPGYAPAS